MLQQLTLKKMSISPMMIFQRNSTLVMHRQSMLSLECLDASVQENVRPEDACVRKWNYSAVLNVIAMVVKTYNLTESELQLPLPPPWCRLCVLSIHSA